MKPHTSGVFKSHCAAVASNFVPLGALVFWYAVVRNPERVMSDPLCSRHEPVVGGGGGGGGGGVVTVTLAVPLFPSLVAVIVTVATPPLLVAHVTVRPLSGFPLASRSAAASCAVPPMTTLGAPGLTPTVATGATVTVTAAVPLVPSLVAVIVAVPETTPVNSPVPLTVATTVLLLAHVTARPLSTLPAESAVVAESCSSWPTSTLAEAGATVTVVTGTGVTRTTAVSTTAAWFPLATTCPVPVSAVGGYCPSARRPAA